MDLTSFSELVKRLRSERGLEPDYQTLCGMSILSFDPGHTTGWAQFADGTLSTCGQIGTVDAAVTTRSVNELFGRYTPDLVLCEDYRVYGWKRDQHVGSDLLTSRVIGCIETIAALSPQTPQVIKQSAQVGKSFVTDDYLKRWSFYNKGQRHAMDAVRHGCHYFLFGTTKSMSARNRRGGVVG